MRSYANDREGMVWFDITERDIADIAQWDEPFSVVIKRRLSAYYRIFSYIPRDGWKPESIGQYHIADIPKHRK